MEDNAKLIETLYERTTDYVKTSYELVKLKVIDKISDVFSSYIPNAVVFVLILLFLLFFNLGLAFWLGEILGKIYFGFFVIAAFYGFIAFVLQFLLHKWLKKKIGDRIIKKILN